jgi:hypothetical protein
LIISNCNKILRRDKGKIMELKKFFNRIQDFFDYMQDALRDVEARWLVFIVAVAIMLISKALGMHGLAIIIALIYIMYFVTFLLK